VLFETDHEKLMALKDLYEGMSVSQSIIYCNSVRRVIDLHEAMRRENFPVCCIHSDMERDLRTRSYEEFKSGKYRVLISSNVTARGIDLQQVSIVINYDIPKCVHTYLHRIGRSGRWGRKGIGINFVTKYDIDKMRSIEKHYQTEITELPANYGDLIRK
jgi:superfamily II DNA/RNA helicase